MNNLDINQRVHGFDLDLLLDPVRLRVLVIDDDPQAALLTKQVFQQAGFDVSSALSGPEGLDRLETTNPSLVVLDLIMPLMDGWDTLIRIKQISDVPVITLSAFDSREHVIKALQMGADDFIAKPFNKDELLARSQAVLRRSGETRPQQIIKYAQLDLVIDQLNLEVQYLGTSIQLTAKMLDIINLLASAAPEVVPYSTLTTRIWGYDNLATRNRLKYFICLLRQKFDQVDNNRKINGNVTGRGYRLIT